MSEFQSNSEDEITCPYCNHGTTDSWERADDGKDECGECGMKFYWSREVSITYSARPDCILNGEPHKFSPIDGIAGAEFCEVCDECRAVNQGLR